MIIKGDVNGDGRINYEDLLLVRWHLLGVIQLTGDAFIAADINNDGKISVSSLAGIKLHITGHITLNEVIE